MLNQAIMNVWVEKVKTVVHSQLPRQIVTEGFWGEGLKVNLSAFNE